LFPADRVASGSPSGELVVNDYPVAYGYPLDSYKVFFIRKVFLDHQTTSAWIKRNMTHRGIDPATEVVLEKETY